MGNISTKVNLGKLRGAKIVTSKSGVKGVFIPTEQNNMFVNEEKGNVYLDLISIPLKQQREDSKDTHLVKQSVSKELQREDDPILGNTIDWDSRGNNNTNTSASYVSDAKVLDDELDF